VEPPVARFAVGGATITTGGGGTTVIVAAAVLELSAAEVAVSVIVPVGIADGAV